MATVTTESELVLRAKDLASQPIEKVVALSKELTAVLAEQTKAAEAGKASQSSLTTALNESTRAYGALQSQVEKLNAAEKIAADRDAKGVELEAAKARLAEAKASANADPKKRTDEEKDSIKALQAEVTSLSRAYDASGRALERSVNTLQKLGITATTSAAEVSKLRESLIAESEASLASIGAAANAQRNFNDLRAAASAKAKAEADAAKEAASQQKRDIEAISVLIRQQDEAVLKLARDQKAAADQAIADNARQLADSVKAAQAQAAALEKELADQAKLQAFKENAARAGSGVSGLSPVGAAPGAVPASNETADSLARILAPAATARANLAGLNEEITRVNETLREADQPTKVYAAALQTLTADARELARQAELIDAYRAQAAEVQKAAEAAERDRAALNDLRDAAARSVTVDDDLTAAITRQERALAASTASYERANASLTRNRASLNAAKIDHEALADAEKILAAGAVEVTSGITKASEALEKGSHGHGDGTFLGFRPDQLHQVVYVLKDITDQLGAGASLGRALETQSGKAFEALYAGAAVAKTAFGALLPIIAGVTGAVIALGSVAVVLNRIYQDTETVREFNAQLNATVDSSRSTGQELEQTARKIQLLGVSFDEAKKAVSEFLEAGLDPSTFENLARSAQNLSDIYGIKFPEAVKELREAFSGNIETVLKLNERYDFLTEATYKQMRALEDQGKMADAVSLAESALRDKLDAVEGKTSAVTEAGRNLTRGWNELLDALSHSRVIEGVVNVLATLKEQLGEVAHGIAVVVNALDGARSSTNTSQGDVLQAKIDASQGRLTSLTHDDNPNLAAIDSEQKVLDALKAQKQQLDQINGVHQDIARTSVTITGEQRAQVELWTKQAEIQRGARGEAQKQADAQALIATRRLEELKYTAEQLKDANTQNLITQAVEEKEKRIAETRAREPTADSVTARLGSETAQLNARASGHTAQADELAVAEDVANKKTEIARQLGITEHDIDTKNGEDAKKAYDALAAYKSAKEAELAAARDKRGEAAANKAANATIAGENEILSIREKIAGLDKTNLEARLAGIDAEYAKYRNQLDKAGREGGNVAGLAGQLDTAEAREKQQATVEFYEKSINDLLSTRKTEYAAINDAVKDGTTSVTDAFTKTSEVTSEFAPKIKTMATEAVNFAKAMAGANPSPQMQAFIAKMEALANKSATTDSRASSSAVAAAAIYPVQSLSRSRDEDVAAQKELQAQGLQTAAQTQANIKAAYDTTTEAIKTQIAEIQAGLKAQLDAGAITRIDYDKSIAELEKLGAAANHVNDFDLELQKTITGSFESGIVSTFDKLTRAVGTFAAGHEKLAGVFRDTEAAFGSFAASFLKSIADMIIKREAFNLVNGLFGGSGAGDGSDWTDTSAKPDALTGDDPNSVGGDTKSPYDGSGGQTSSTSGGIGALGGSLIKGVTGAVAKYATTAIMSLFHDGGVVGSSPNMSRLAPVGLFMNAPRYHDGTVVGLGSDEQAAILQRGEEVLSKSDARNVMNGGGRAAAASNPVAIRQVLAFDQKDLAAAMAGSHGEQVVLTHIKNNTGTVKTLLNR